MRDFNQEGSVQPEQVLKETQGAQTALKIPSGGSDNTSNQPSKFIAGSKAQGAAKRDFARRQPKKNHLVGNRVEVSLLKPSLQTLSVEHDPRHCREILIFLDLSYPRVAILQN